MKAARIRTIWLLVALVARIGFAQTAALPTAYTGPWEQGEPPEGWVFYGLGGADYNPDYDGINNGAAKLDGTGDFISIHFDGYAGAVSYWIKGLTFISGGVFRVEQSINGTNWTALQSYTEMPTNAVFQTYATSLASLYIRFIYAERVTGNVGIDGISIVPFVQPEIGTISATGGVARVSIPESVVGRTYALEYSTRMTTNPVTWMPPVDSRGGTGGSLEMQDLSPTNTVRYYRVRDATP